MTEMVIEYLMKKHNMKRNEAEKHASNFFTYLDSIAKEEGNSPLSEEAKAEIIKIDIEELMNHYFIYNNFISQDKKQP